MTLTTHDRSGSTQCLHKSPILKTLNQLIKPWNDNSCPSLRLLSAFIAPQTYTRELSNKRKTSSINKNNFDIRIPLRFCSSARVFTFTNSSTFFSHFLNHHHEGSSNMTRSCLLISINFSFHSPPRHIYILMCFKWKEVDWVFRYIHFFSLRYSNSTFFLYCLSSILVIVVVFLRVVRHIEISCGSLSWF